MCDALAVQTADSISKGTTTLDAAIAGYIAGTVETTQAVVALFSYIDGVTPSSDKITALATDFTVKQLDYYTNVLKSANAALGPYEALGKALADTDPAFATIGAPSISDADFISINHLNIFKVVPSAAQAAHFQSQINYFTGLYTSAGGVSAAQAALEARGATLGQMIGYAFTDPAFRATSSLDDQVAAFLTSAARGTAVYGDPLPPSAGVVGVSTT
jgi:hypothetical protein